MGQELLPALGHRSNLTASLGETLPTLWALLTLTSTKHPAKLPSARLCGDPSAADAVQMGEKASPQLVELRGM